MQERIHSLGPCCLSYTKTLRTPIDLESGEKEREEQERTEVFGLATRGAVGKIHERGKSLLCFFNRLKYKKRIL